MRVIKPINNNITICLDNDNNEVVVFGKGVGFQKKVNDVIKLSSIERTYYKVNTNYINMLHNISDDIMKISIKIMDYSRVVLDNPINPNTVFTLADHIDFSLKRFREKMNIGLPIINDIEHIYEKEYKVGLFALNIIKEEVNLILPKQEAGMIALHIINAGTGIGNSISKNNEEMIKDIVAIVEKYCDISIGKDGFNYSRFVSHMTYLFLRCEKKNFSLSKNSDMYKDVVDDYPETHKVVERITIYIEDTLKCELTDEEKLYLMIHVNRLSTREVYNNQM